MKAFEFPPRILRRLLGLTLVCLAAIALSREDWVWQLPVGMALLTFGLPFATYPLKSLVFSKGGVLVISLAGQRWFDYAEVEEIRTRRRLPLLGLFRTDVTSAKARLVFSSLMTNYLLAISEIVKKCGECEVDELTSLLAGCSEGASEPVEKNYRALLLAYGIVLSCCLLVSFTLFVRAVVTMIRQL